MLDEFPTAQYRRCALTSGKGKALNSGGTTVEVGGSHLKDLLGEGDWLRAIL